MKSIQRILAIFLKEVRQLRRDRLTFGMIVGIPVIQLMMFGYAINMDVRHIPAGVADMSSTAASREAVINMAQTQVIDIVAQASDAQELELMMRQGEISVGIYVPGDFERRRLQPGRAAIQLMVDGTDTVVQGAVAQMVQSGRTSPYNDPAPGHGNAHLLQPRAALAREHGTRPDRRHPDHDHDHVYRGRHRAGTGTR